MGGSRGADWTGYGWLAEEDTNGRETEEKKGKKEDISAGEWYVGRVEEDSFTVSAVSLALEVDLRRLKLNRALREKGILVYC